MNLVLIHIGSKPIPGYFWIAASQVRKYFKGNLYFILPSEYSANIELIQKLDAIVYYQNDFADNQSIKKFESVSFMQQTYGEFWSVSFSRLFYLEALIKLLNLKDVIHIENDVMIYIDPESMLTAFRKNYPDRVAINPVGERYATFAYGYVPNYEAISDMNSHLVRLLELGQESLMEIIGESMINEMMLLKICADRKIVGYLPSMPYGKYSEHLEDFNCIFDPASYGQFIFGTGSDNAGWTGQHHFIGRAIDSKSITVKNREVIHYDSVYPLANMHIHSKQLELAI